MSEVTKIADLARMDDKDAIKRPLRVTVRQAQARQESPNTYKPGEMRISQKIQVSDETGSCWCWANECQELKTGDVLQLQAVNSPKGWGGCIVKRRAGYPPDLSFYPKGVSIVGVPSGPNGAGSSDPWFMQEEPAREQTPPARPQQVRLPLPAQPSGRRTSREMEEWLLGVTERLFVGLSDGLTNSAPEGQRLECAQSMAVSLAIAVGRGEIDYIPESKPAPSSLPERPMQEAPPFEGGEDSLDWGTFGDQEGN
jgi:hypothetical protein